MVPRVRQDTPEDNTVTCRETGMFYAGKLPETGGSGANFQISGVIVCHGILVRRVQRRTGFKGYAPFIPAQGGVRMKGVSI